LAGTLVAAAVWERAALDELLDHSVPSSAAPWESSVHISGMRVGPIYDHLRVVEACAPRQIHVMVEKPLAVSLAHAETMAASARTYRIHLLTNYETTWYASTYAAYRMAVQEAALGSIRKVVVHDGHAGPVEIGCNAEFVAWLTDPVLNGGGAVVDFGCYGANLITWFMGGAEPITVTAVLQTLKPDIYPHVDDEATIILRYPQAVGIVQGSWNWPVGRKDRDHHKSGARLPAEAQHPSHHCADHPLQRVDTQVQPKEAFQGDGGFAIGTVGDVIGHPVA
jgi:predicted dehydrogenase